MRLLLIHPRMRIAHSYKVLIKLFQKFAGCEAEPRGLNLLIPNYQQQTGQIPVA